METLLEQALSRMSILEAQLASKALEPTPEEAAPVPASSGARDDQSKVGVKVRGNKSRQLEEESEHESDDDAEEEDGFMYTPDGSKVP